MKTRHFTALLAAVACVILPLHANEHGPLNADDVKFVKSAAQSAMNEVKIATLGSQKAHHPEVKILAATLVHDHEVILTEIKALAEKKGVQVSASIDSATADTFKELEKKSGDEFDKAFIKKMDEGHIKSIKSYEEEQKDAKDADLKAWVDKTVAVIKKHHEVIKKLK